MSPLLFYLREEVVELTEGWFQHVIDQEVEGVELVVLEEAGSRRQKILRLYVDHPDGVTHELCARVSGVVGRALDEIDAFDGAYVLEVSSPGIARPLRRRSHFEAQLGKKVYVKTRTPVEGSKVWQGILLEVGTDEIVVQEAGRDVRIPLGEIGSAHLIYEFS
jgi:ribosome maturation factor RimP